MGNPATKVFGSKPKTDSIIIWGIRESELHRISKATARALLVNAAHCVANHLEHDLSRELGMLAKEIIEGDVEDLKRALAPFDEVMSWAVTPD